MRTSLSPSQWWRGAVALSAGTVVVLLTSGCALGNKQAMADRVINAARRTEASGSVQATMTLDAKVIPSKVPRAPGPPKITPGHATNLATVIDFGARRAALAIPGGDVAHAAMVFDGSRVYQRRDVKLPTGAAALIGSSQGAQVAPVAGPLSNLALLSAAAAATAPVPAEPAPVPTTEAPKDPNAPGARLQRAKVQRRWAGFDFAGLGDKDPTRVAGNMAISPVEFMRLAEGALAGSMKLVGTETVDGVTTTHYRLNVSRDKAERNLSEHDRKQLAKEYRASAVAGDVFPAEAWIDANGKLRRFTVRIRQSLDRTDRDDLTVTIDMHDFGVPVAVVLPDPKETATVRDVGQLVHTGAGT